MDAATIGMVANLVTLAIIAITAYAALRQIRHNHTANELQVHLHFVNQMNTSGMMDEIRWTSEFSARMKDPAYREAFARGGEPEDFARVLKLARFFEQYASLVIASGLSERLIFFEYSGAITSVWDNLYEATLLIRTERTGKYAGRSFEHLAMRAKRYSEKQLPHEYDRLQRDPRLVALETEQSQ